MNSGSIITAKLASVNWPCVVLEAAQDRSRRGVDQEDRQQRQGGADEDPRQDPVAPLRLQQADQRAHADEQQPDAADAHRQGDRREQELGDHLVARAVPQVGRARACCPGRRRSRQEGSARPAGRSRTRMPPTHRPRPISPAIGRTNRDSPGLSVRATAIHPPPRGNSSGARHRQVTRPASHQIVTGRASCRRWPSAVASVLVPPLLTHSSILVQKVPAPTLPGMRSEASKPMPAALFAISEATLSL